MRAGKSSSNRCDRVSASLLCAVLVSLLILTMAPRVSFAGAELGNGQGTLRVMTYNADEGTDYIELLEAKTFSDFVLAVGQTITQVRATNPPARMQALAKQILAAGPTLVSLQELDQWSTGSFNPVTSTCGPVTLEFDMVQELLEALKEQGGHYELAVQAQQFAFPPTPGLILPGTFLCVSVSNYNAILARTDLHPLQFQWNNPQSGEFAAKVVFPIPQSDETVPLPAVWVSVDAQFHHRPFRLIGTHLDSVDLTGGIRRMQGAELRAGPANTPLPVIIAMDSNAQAAPAPQDQTYLDFVAAGYDDAWSSIFPNADGFTCCQAQFVNNPISGLTTRIDLILTLGNMGNIEPQAIALFGADPASKTPGGLWPSDHAGVAARLKLAGE